MLAGQTRDAAPKLMVKKVTVAVKLNNNMIETIQDLPQALDLVMENPLLHCQWLDLSFNLLRSIEPVLLQMQSLKALYMHGNQIKSLPSVEKLKELPKLISLTLNGNPIECSRSYRMHVIGAVSNLRSLDHSTITEDESQNASTWFDAHQKRVAIRKKEEEEKRLNEIEG